MELITHIIIALASLATATLTLAAPTGLKFRASYILVAATVLSGTYLVWTQPAHLMQACTSGLVYLGLVTAAIVAARYRFGRLQSQAVLVRNHEK
jgi:hypothetical protein